MEYQRSSVTSPLSGSQLRSLSGLCGVAPSRGRCSQVSPALLVLAGGEGGEREGRGTKGGDRRSVLGFSSSLSAFASSMSECACVGGGEASRARNEKKETNFVCSHYLH